MSWRLAKSLEVLRSQINAAFPKRDTGSDGSIGDSAHSKTPSDHNPNSSGVVCAIDVTNDPPHEAHCALVAEAIRASKDPRVKYLIYNYFICRSYPKPGIPAWVWSRYEGPNAHSHHLHISVNAASADDIRPWRIK